MFMQIGQDIHKNIFCKGIERIAFILFHYFIMLDESRGFTSLY